MPNLLRSIFFLTFQLVVITEAIIAQDASVYDTAFSFTSDSCYKDGINIGKGNLLQTSGRAWKRAVLSAPNDFVQMKNIVSRNWSRTAAYTSGIAILILADKPVTQFYQDKIESNIVYTLPRLPGPRGIVFGDANGYLNYSVLGMLAGATVTHFDKGQRAALNAIKAQAYSYLIAHVGLKALFARQRPDPTLSDGVPPNLPFTQNPYEFFRFRPVTFRHSSFDGSGFPSFHATAYYAVAKVMAMEFNNYWIPYSAATFLFFANLKGHRHWVGDMVAGGVLGSLIGKSVVEGSRKWDKVDKPNNFGVKRNFKLKVDYKVLPMVSSQSIGINLFAAF